MTVTTQRPRKFPPATIVQVLVAAGWDPDSAKDAGPRMTKAARRGMHGTPEARDRHLERGEPLCHRCAPLGVPGEMVAHGTPRGWKWHQRRNQEPCGACRRAWAAYMAAHRSGKVRRDTGDV